MASPGPAVRGPPQISRAPAHPCSGTSSGSIAMTASSSPRCVRGTLCPCALCSRPFFPVQYLRCGVQVPVWPLVHRLPRDARPRHLLSSVSPSHPGCDPALLALSACRVPVLSHIHPTSLQPPAFLAWVYGAGPVTTPVLSRGYDERGSALELFPAAGLNPKI